MTEKMIPFANGDFIYHDSSRTLGKVKSCYFFDDEILADVTLISIDGHKIGRQSPVCGGPRTYEPALNVEQWRRVQNPRFPLEERLKWVDNPDEPGTVVAQKVVEGLVGLPNRSLQHSSMRKRKKVVAAVKPVLPNNNFNSALEARAMRIAAQHVRDSARAATLELVRNALLKEAKAMEEQASKLLLD